ncbi:MAG: hypothetical protein GY714_03610 [Desulfobacterales bacterium]|nr:hypothetical protein [Desulfobacterales bacterium]
MEAHLQTIIGVDKKNPFFTLIRNTKDNTISVYLGAALYEVIDDQADNPNLKFMIARLFNAGVNKQSLIDTFGFCYNTIKRWGDALKTNDAMTIVHALSGQGAPKKLTIEIQSFVTHRFKSIYATNIYSYSKEIREEILEIFHQDISAETLRPLFNALKEKYFQKKKVVSVPDTPNTSQLFKFTTQLALPPAKSLLSLPAHEDNPSAHNNSQAHTILSNHTPLFTKESDANQFSLLTSSCDNNIVAVDSKCDATDNRKISEIKNMSQKGFCYHVGGLIFAPFMNVIQKSNLGDCKPYVIQWLMAVLLGAKNIEQSKLLNYKSLALFLDKPTRNLHIQRKKLKEFAIDDNFTKLLNLNAILVDIDKKSDFYYDPHTKHYTGLLALLKSWCSKVRMATRIINTDFIHTADGFPVYIKNGDTFDDMRVRFFKDIKEFRRITKMPDDKVITVCVDRGIFSEEVFKKVAGMKNLHIVSWEKDYKKDKWDENQEKKTGSIILERNNKTDTKLITYEYQEYRWDKNDKIRQLIVRLPEKKGNGIVEVSILTDDLSRAATVIIFLMLKRWIQENDFKYLIAHFGLDQITSYLFDNYKDIAETITDKEHVSGTYKALTKELDKIRKKLKTTLHKKHIFDTKFGIYQDISELIKGQKQMLISELAKELTNVKIEKTEKKPTKKQEESYKKNITKIVHLTNEYDDKFTERAATKKIVSKIEELSEKGTKKMDTAQKQLMDIIKIIARNIFYLAFEPFKSKYNNYRDDHVIFRAITYSDGEIETNNSEMKINILPTIEIPPKVRKILSEIFEEINMQKTPIFNDKKLNIKLEITEKINSFFAYYH